MQSNRNIQWNTDFSDFKGNENWFEDSGVKCAVFDRVRQTVGKRFFDLLPEVERRCSQVVSSHSTVYLTIIPRARVGYEMVDSQRGA